MKCHDTCTVSAHEGSASDSWQTLAYTDRPDRLITSSYPSSYAAETLRDRQRRRRRQDARCASRRESW